LDGFSDTGGLEQNQWQQHEVGHKLYPGRMNKGENLAPDRDTDQEADQNRRHAPPNVRDALAVDEEDVSNDHQFHEHQRRIQNTIGVKEQRDWNRNRRKAVPQGAVDGGRHERDEHKHD
jgi:hypothetical protein